MTDNNAIQRAFEDIISSTSESIDKTAYKLSAEEKQLVAELLVMRAEEEIINCGVHSTSISIAKKSLALACELVPTNIEIWHERGVALATQDTEEDLLEAITCFEVATKLNENFFEAWYAWASVLTRLGLIHDEVSYLFDANIKYLKAEAVANQEMKDEPDFYWNRGLLLSMIAKYSGEASELSQAIAYFRKAKKLGLEEKDFYNDFAQALVEFGFLINREEYLVEAAELFQSSLPQDIDHDLFSSDEEKEDLANRYFYLANCYYYLFGTHLDHDYFQLAHEAFTNAVTLDPEFYQAWLQMGSLFLLGSKRWQKVDHLRSSVASLAEAYYLAPDDVHVLARLTEALALIGAHEENITCLRQAEMTGHRALILHSDSVDLMTSQAMVSISFGRYFGEESYFLTAKEQAEAGLVVSPTHAPLLHILAQAQFFLSEINEDLLAMDHSLELFEKVSQSDVGRLACFWNEWGIALIHAADITHDKKYLFSAEEKFERAIILQDTVIPEW
ncbi:MAG: hypothetical protein JWO53_1372, partial [Chlamydiia bacterium]|nr:hypothetical protein [Chlamydiia bacterium]